MPPYDDETLIPEYEEPDDLELIPKHRERREGRLSSATPRRREKWQITDDDDLRLESILDDMNRPAMPAPGASVPPPLGLAGTVREGAKSAARALGAAADTYQGDEAEVVAAAKAAAEAPRDPRLAKFLSDIEDQKNALPEDPGLWQAIKIVGKSAIENPKGFGLMVAEQIPNSAVALGGGAAGALAGSVAGPVGTVIGGIAGMFGANTALETGHKAIEAAGDESFTPEEQRRVTTEGLKKAGVITGVDTATLGMTKFIMGTTRRAMEAATVKTLTDKGVDVTNAAALKTARETPEIVEAVQSAQKLAQEASDKLGKKVMRTGGAIALETIGEGAGEYLGEFAATGKADAVDAVVEAFAGLSQSMGEVAFTSALNKRAMKRLFGTKEEAEAAAKADTSATGVEHEVKPHPIEPDKFVAAPKTRSTQGVQLERDADGNLREVQPESRQADFNIANKPGFMHSAEDLLALQEKRRKNAEAYAQNPLVLPGGGKDAPAAPPPPAATPTIAGKPVTALSNNTLIYSMSHGSSRAARAAQAELERRQAEGVDPAIANAPESTAEAVTRIVATGREKAQEVANPPVADNPTPEPAETLEAQMTAFAEGRKPGVLFTPGETVPATIPPGVKTAAIPGRGTLLYRDEATLQAALENRMGDALGYGVAEKPADATAVVTARDKDGTVIQDVATDGSKAVTDAAAAVAGPDGTVETRPVEDALGERDLAARPELGPAFGDPVGVTAEKAVLSAAKEGRHSTKDPLTGNWKWLLRNGYATEGKGGRLSLTPKGETRLAEMSAEKKGEKSGTDELPKTPETPETPKPKPDAVSGDAQKGGTQADSGIRPLVDALIKRRATARQIGREKTFDKALVAAKALLAGEGVLPARFGSAAAIFKDDKPTADILKALQVKAEEAKTSENQARLSENVSKSGQTPDTKTTPVTPETPVTPPKAEPEKPAETTGEGAAEKKTEFPAKQGSDVHSQGYRAAMDGFAMSPPQGIKGVERLGWEDGWLAGAGDKKTLLAGTATVVVGQQKAVPVVSQKSGKFVVVWRDERAGKDHRSPEEARADMERGEAATAPEKPAKPEQTDAQKKKQEAADAKKALATRKRVERDLHVLASTNPELMDMAGTMDLESFTEGVNEAFAKEIARIANEYGGPEKDAVLELVKDGKAVLPPEFFSSAYASAKLAYQEQKLIESRDPQLYRETLEAGLTARNIEKGGQQEAQYKDGFDHALKGKTRSTLPQGTKHGEGYDDARKWIRTEDGKAWFEGKRQSKQKSTGEALKRWWERAKKGLDGLTTKDMKKAWEQILKSTTRAELFPNLLADDATPGAKEWLDKLRGEVATFPVFYVREMIDSEITRGRYGTKAESVFEGSHTSYKGRAKDIDWTGRDVAGELDAERTDAKDAVSAIYEVMNKESTPDAEALAKQREVINDEKKWMDLAHFASSNYSHNTYKHSRNISEYFNKVELKKKDKARLDLTKQIAQEYQQHTADLAKRFEGLKTLAEIRAVIEEHYGKPGDYKLGSTEAGDRSLYYDNDREIKAMLPQKPDSWDYKYGLWQRLEETEIFDRPEKFRKDTLMRPRLDKIERVMPDERKGRSVTSAEFKKAFNFSDVTIGEYVTAKEAEDHLNYAYDALMSLALMLGAKPAQLSFGGKLHFSIGALGHGKYAAHFQPKHPKADGTTVPVINVTKTKGDGSVLHEYFHAIDFMTTDPALKKAIDSVKRLLKGTPKAPEEAEKVARNFLQGWQSVRNGGRMTRKEMAIFALKNWYGVRGERSVAPTQFFRHAQALDEGKGGDPYWSNQYEPWARASESWGFDRLKDSKQRDDYLQSDWAADGKVTAKTHRGTPYPVGEERKRLNGLMDEFTKAIEWTDAGPILKADHIWQKDLPFDLMMKPYGDAVQKAIDNIDALETAVNDENRQKREEREAEVARLKAEREKEEREALFGKPEENAPENFPEKNEPPSVPETETPPAEPPTPSSTPEGDAPLSEDELSAIFDDVAAGSREETQEQPDAPAPGEKLDAQAWTTDDVLHLLNLVMQGRMILWSGEKFATELGLPTIHSFQGKGDVRHMGYGVFQVSTRDYKASWTAGGAMEHTPGGKAYTTLSVEEGFFVYPKDEVIRTLNTVLKAVNEEKAAKKPETKAPGPKTDKPLPDLKDEQDKTAGVLAAEFAKHGVKGIDKTLSGLVKLFGGGPGKLQSFPGGFDEKTYAQAKVLFKEAAEEFRKSGLSFKEFVRVFFKALIDQFGDGVKPYAVRFAGEYQKTYEQVETKDETKNEPEEVAAADSPSSKLADWMYDKLETSQTVKWQDLFAEADRQFGGTQANGAYTPKDAYDAVELAINRHIIEKKIDASKAELIFAEVAIGKLENLLDYTPTQTKRTAEMDEFQQFSTPPHFAFVANWVAALNNRDVYLEPSAGVGGLASFAKAANVREIIVNELSERRRALLQTLPFDRYFTENAEQLSNILPEDVKPTVIVMNPPFSSTAGRMEGTRDTKNGARHIEEALKLLADGGRLVAIVGEGMAAGTPAFRAWWTKIQKEYNVRANIGVSGASYAKYGTTFDNQLLVIDKNGATTGEIITAKVDHPVDALKLLEGVRNDRPTTVATDEDQDVAGGGGRKKGAEGSGGGTPADTTQNPGDDSTSSVGGGGQRGAGGKGGGGGGRAAGDGSNKSDGGSKTSGKSGRRGKDGNAPPADGSGDGTGDSKSDSATGERDSTEVRLEQAKGGEAGAITNSVFEPYTPKKVRIEGAVPHNTPLVESAAMAAVSPPDPTYTPNLPKKVITDGLLSDAQLEAVVYAGQAHAQMLRDGETRRGFFLGDGTGVGKGRQISGIIMDNIRQGRKKAVWISKKKELIEDAKRDFGDLGGDAKLIFGQSKHKTNDVISAKEGILFSAYPTLRSPSKEGRAAQKAAGNQRRPDKDGITFERIRQMVNWLGKDFDGVIVFDESHEMGNAVAATGGGRGAKPTSDQAEAGLQLQAALPKARIVYVSATGATEVTNLGYAPRLGLWGDGTPFESVNAFINAMSRSVSAMELVAQNLKQMGLYLARSLSFDGVTYEQLQHDLTPFQRDVYDELAGGWQIVLNNMEAAMEQTGQTGGGKDTAKIKSYILSQFWSGHQRFFNQIITASQMPSIIEQIHTDMKNGLAVVLQLTNTDEAGQNRAIAKAAAETKEEGAPEEELNLSPIEQLTSLILKAYPVLQYESVTDADGNKHLVPVRDSKGNQVVNREAVAARDALIEGMKSMRIPDAPLQMLINEFGVDAIAEVTGRTQRLVRNEDGKYEVEKRGGHAVAADAQAFKDGKKNILVFSQAGGTGFSFHSDKRYKNRRKRAHYIMQAGWSADKAVQGFGRSHRTNQENEPVYRLAKTDIPGHKRFISSIARRLEQLGALTAGQRDTAGGSIFSAADNLESAYATHAVSQFFTKLISLRQFPQMPADLLQQMGLTKLVHPDTGALVESALPPVTRFLNRLLSLRLDTQTQVFDAFMQEMEIQIETARRLGTFDDGLATVRHVGADVKQETEVYRDPSTNADVRYIEINYHTKNEFHEFEKVQKTIDYYNRKNPGSANWFKNALSGRVMAMWTTDQTVTLKTGAIARLYGVYRTSGTAQEQVKTDNLERLSKADAQALWEAENEKRPETREHPLHMVVGGILPLWDRFNEEHVQVVRIAVDDGRRFLGRQIANKDLDDTLNRLDVKSAAAKMTGQDIVKAVMEGKSVLMSNGWTMKKVRLSNENRIEIDLGGKYLTNQAATQITESGGIYERVNWAARYFIPTDAKRGGETMSAIMQKTGSNAVTVKGDEEDAAPTGDNQGPAFSRGEGSSAGLGRSKVFSIVKAIRAKWANAPEVVIVDDMNDAAVSDAVRAENERQLSKGAKGQPEGFVYGGRVYVVASQMNTPGDVVRVLLHESLGHFGLRGMFGDELNRILKQVAALRRKDVEAKAREYGLDMEVERDRLIAAEEVLAELAQTNPKSGFVQRAIAAIRKWLRENIEHYKDLKLTDGEIISNYIIPAREFVQRGRTETQGGLAGAFSRTERTRSTYNKRIDELFKGKAFNPRGVRVMDRSDVLAMMGYSSGPVNLVESKVGEGIKNHPRMTAEHWKKIPAWLDSPALVFDSASVHGRLVFVAPEQLDGAPILMIIKPAKGGGVMVSLLVNAYDKDSGTSTLQKWIDGTENKESLLRYYDKDKSLALVGRSGLYLAGMPQARGSKGRIYTNLDLVKYRKEHPFPGATFSRPASQTDAPAFRKWFVNSKVVDESGKPLVVYHGTQTWEQDGRQLGDIDAFDRLASVNIVRRGHSIDTVGNWFSTNPGKGGAEKYGKAIYPVYLSIQNPHETTFNMLLRRARMLANGKDDGRKIGQAEVDAYRKWQKDVGMDGIKLVHDPRDGSTEFKDQVVWVALEPQQIKSAIGNDGNFDPESPSIVFSRSAASAGATPATVATVATPATPAAPFRDRMDKIVDSLIYNFQDRFKPLKDIQKRAGLVPEDEDAALAEERYSGIVRARTEEFEQDMRTPLVKAIHDSGVAYEDVEDYLHALHAPSRNAAMRAINPTEEELKAQTQALEAQRDGLANDADVKDYVKARRELRQAEADIEDGIADESLGRMIKQEIAQLKKMASVTDYIDAVDKLRALRNVKPFEGDNTALSGMSNAESKAILAKIDGNGSRKAMERISALVDSITSKTRQIFIDSGLEKAETIEAWNKQYEHYVPLHRDEVDGGTGMPRIGQGFNIRGRESKRATGSNREVTHILAHVVAQHEAAIIRSEKSKVDRALYKFAQMHPDPALWTLDTAPMVRTVDATTGLAVSRVDPSYKNRPEVLTLKIDGEEHTISFNERNPEGMRLAASMKNLSAQDLGEVTQMVGSITRFVATMNTTANPVFIARNFMRDLQTAFVNLSDTELADKKREVFADVPAAIKGMWNLSRGDKTSQWAKYAQEFRNAGGQTGWMEHYRDIGERADKLKKELALMGPGRGHATRRTLTSWWEIIGDANNAVENGTRLAAFVHARKAGMSEGRAASLAKNLTVNFNARGAKGIEVNMWYMFMNASIQGSARLIKALSNKQVQRIVGGVILSGFLMDVLARSLAGDEDEDGENDYDQLPEYVKSMNFVLWVDDRPVTIPMPYGYNFFASVGRKMSEMMGRENYSPVRSATDLAAVFLDAFSPTGQAGSMLQYAAPTVADPFIQWAENKNFAGNPLRREQHPFGVPKPEYQMGFKSSSAPARWLAETLSNETGGNEVRPGLVNLNPAFFDFAVTSVLGGAGRSHLQAVSLPFKAAGDEEIKAREVPFFNIFFSAKPEYQIEGKYYEASRAFKMAKNEMKRYQGDEEMAAQIRADHGKVLRLGPLASYTESVLANIRKKEEVLEDSDAPDKAERRKALEQKRREYMSRFNKKYAAAISA